MCDRKSSRRHGKRESSSRSSESGSRSADGAAPEVPIVIPDGKEFCSAGPQQGLWSPPASARTKKIQVTLTGFKKECFLDWYYLNRLTPRRSLQAQLAMRGFVSVRLVVEAARLFPGNVLSACRPVCPKRSPVGAAEALSKNVYANFGPCRSCWLPLILLLKLRVCGELAGNHIGQIRIVLF